MDTIVTIRLTVEVVLPEPSTTFRKDSGTVSRLDTHNATIPTGFASDEDLAAWLTENPAIIGGNPGEVWHDSYTATNFDDLAVFCEDPQDREQVEGIVSYYFNGPAALGGEFWPGPVVEDRLFLFNADMTKSRRDDIGAELSSGTLECWLAEGTPIRSTNRAGVGTSGTRKYNGLAGCVRLAWR